MKVSAKLLYCLMNERYSVTRLGRSFPSEELPLPVFYSRGEAIEPGGFYVARTEDLPQVSHTDCLFVCTGNRPTQIGSIWRGEVFYVADRELDIFALFNVIIQIFNKLSRWDRDMQALLDRNASIDEFVRVSLPVFENCITITDYNLRILVNCEVTEGPDGQPKVIISDRYDRVPDQVSMTFVDSYRQNTGIREPFAVKGQKEDPEGNNYCINLHIGGNYLGTCTLWNKLRPMRESDFLLFQQFADYIRQTLSQQSRTSLSQLVTLKNIFLDLLQCLPVSKEDLNRVLDLLQTNMELQGVSLGCWHCLVIRSANRGKMLPAEYLCTSLENILPHSTVVAYDEMLACFCMIPEGQNCEERVCNLMTPYLRDRNFRMGVSAPFRDIFKARDYYLQSKAILETGQMLSREQLVYRFEDYILPYMLLHCSGEFETDSILTQGLIQLRALENGVDYWDTLRRYLDNECNASKTAQELFLHRSSLQPRLEKIRSSVPMDTPEQRLYLRMCITLLDILEAKKTGESKTS